MSLTFWGAVMLALAVSIGAFGAHGLQGKLDAYSMNIYERAVLYHFIHALGILLVASLAASNAISLSLGRWAGLLLLSGIVFFSGSLYVLALSGNRMWGAVTPIGGVSFIAGWVVLAVAGLKVSRA
jgi:uncharacterized membrane protein YgdD (TMEM256/DUF423 family)